MEPVLGNLDLYSGTWTRTRLCTHFVFLVLVYVLKLRSWPNIDGTYGMYQTYQNTWTSQINGRNASRADFEISHELLNRWTDISIFP